MFFAIIAASIRIVPVPQHRSTNGSRNFHHDNNTSPAAIFSLSGATPTCFLQPLLYNLSHEVFTNIRQRSALKCTYISLSIPLSGNIQPTDSAIALWTIDCTLRAAESCET
jgi:hypothetical protein